MSFAAIYAGLGDPEKALAYLERAVEVRDTSLPVHLLSTEFDALRNHPQFQDAVRPDWPAAGRIRSRKRSSRTTVTRSHVAELIK